MSDFENNYNAALSAATSNRAKTIYVRTPSAVYELSPKATTKWLTDFYDGDPMRRLDKLGKKILVPYQGGFTKFPITESYPQTVKVMSKEGDILYYLSVRFDGKQSWREIETEIQIKQHPKKNDMRHYKALVAMSKKVGWPTAYHADLTTHDKKSLTFRMPDLPFGWILRESGTYMIFPEQTVSVTSDRNAPPSHWVSSMRKNYDDINAHYKFYVWDGLALVHKTPESWGEWIDTKHRAMNKK
jgi:hypothetical protein